MSEERNQHRSVQGGPGLEVAVLAGGCFWGAQEILRGVPGFVDTAVGYTGGSKRYVPVGPNRSVRIASPGCPAFSSRADAASTNPAPPQTKLSATPPRSSSSA